MILIKKMENYFFVTTGVLFAILILDFTGCSKPIKRSDKKTIIIKAPEASSYFGVYEKIINNFPDKTIKIKFQRMENDKWRQKLLLEIAGGSIIDIFRMAPAFVNEFATRGQLLPLNSCFEKKQLANYYHFLINAFSMNDTIYGLPENLAIQAMFYNKDLFDKAGVSYPDEFWTWEDLVNAAQKMTIKDSNGIVSQYGLLVVDIWYDMIRYYGGHIFNDAKTRCIINNPTNREAIKFLYDLFYIYKITPSGYEREQTGMGYSEAFEMNKVAIFPAWSHLVINFKKNQRLNWGLSYIPRVKGRKRLVMCASQGWAISKNTKYPKESIKILSYLASETANKQLVKLGDSIPHLKNSDLNHFLNTPNEEINIYNKILMDSLQNTEMRELELYKTQIPYAELKEICNNEFIKCLRANEQNVERTLINIEEKVNRRLNDE
ncbi:MAG: hypothetical protein A2096_15930 [Spirochaetes bacterium GWF1_41_5]|nr:MAG: hypothetical protein A2096_15930 [Spirochaetes bacterium GWF1_41_5]